MEGRTYFDFYVNSSDEPIPPGASITRGLSYFPGTDLSKVRSEVRAVIFKDGSSAGDPVWVNAILARRLRFFDRTLSLHELLTRQLGTGISREALVDLVRTAQAKTDKELPDDDLRVMDELAFYGAISTFDNNRQAPVEVVLKRYLAFLKLRMAELERSRPTLTDIRALPVTTPEPLSETSLPVDFRANPAQSQAALPYAGTLNSCTVFPADAQAVPTPTLTCSDSSDDQVTQNNEFTFKMEFDQYTASTKKDVTVQWSSPANQGPFTANGVCTAFNDCDDAPDVYYIQGSASGVGYSNTTTLPFTIYSGQSAKSFYWLLDRFPSPTFSLCDECDINPSGKENPVSTNAPVQSTRWSFNYACTVTP